MSDTEETIRVLRQYEGQLNGILRGFNRTHDGLHIAEGDGARFERVVVELRDFYDDTLGLNTYGRMTVSAFNEGLKNFTESPSYRSVERVKALIATVITRIERNPDILKRPGEAPTPAVVAQEPLSMPEKVTLRWMFDHVPHHFWGWLLGLLIVAFTAGMSAAKLSFVQEWIGIKVESSAQGSQPHDREQSSP